MASIYALTDPRVTDPTLRVRYVGKTQRSLAYRLQGHITKARCGVTHRDCWIRQLTAIGLAPGIEALQEVDDTAAAAAEVATISMMREAGAPLTNLTNGGDGVPGMKMSRAAIEKVSLAKRGRPLSPEHRAKLAEHWHAWRGNPHNETARKRAQRAALIGVPRTQELRDKVSAAKRGRVVISAEQREAISRTLTGQVQSAETRAKRAASSHGEWTEREREAHRRFRESPAFQAYRERAAQCARAVWAARKATS